MTDYTIDTIIEEVEKFNDSIAKTLGSLGISNTGEAARSLRVEYGNDFVKSYGIFYLEFLDKGRGPTRNKGDGVSFERNIRFWVQTKLGLTDPKEIETATHNVMAAIHRNGTLIFQGKKPGIGIDKKIEDLQKAINSQLPQKIKADVKRVLDKYLKIYKRQTFNL